MARSIEGIILKSFNYGENHKIVKVLTKELGIIGIYIQNANKANSKNSALAQPLTCAHFNLKDSTQPNQDLYFLYQGEIINHYLHLKMDFEKVTYCYLMAEIILKGCHESVQMRYVYQMMKTFLDFAEAGYSAYSLAIIFQLKMLPLLGVAPVLDCCANCSSTQHIVTLSVSAGGLLCAYCMPPQEPIQIQASSIPLVRALYKLNIETVNEIEMDEELLHPIEAFLDQYYDTYTGLTLSSKKFLKKI
ncbi:MAG TPA: DNA repair protein RecO [Firmicutes bacterium]|nr:DNA repair protein RecO [Bacillota bacterium]